MYLIFYKTSRRAITRCRGETDDVSGFAGEYGYAYSDLLSGGFLRVPQADERETVSVPFVAEPIVRGCEF